MAQEEARVANRYDAADRSPFGRDECEAAVGRAATLPLTGRIVAAGESPAGAWVRFRVDERWGFGSDFTLVMDLDPFELQP